MLKWTNSAQKPLATDFESNGFVQRKQTPYTRKRPRRRTTICQMNKENLSPMLTSTPMVGGIEHYAASETKTKRLRPLQLNFDCDKTTRYATTLPKFAEEYSPNNFLPTGQELALRGLLPDVFAGNKRYFESPLFSSKTTTPENSSICCAKRQLETQLKENADDEPSLRTIKESTKMCDQSLDKLINAILESACKTEKKKKQRKSLNLRRRTLLRNQEENIKELSLSPSYAACDDPASDLSFLLIEPTTAKRIPTTPVLPATPLPHTPLLQTALSREQLLRMPTPAPTTPYAQSVTNESTTTFNLETLRRPTRKRRSKVNSELHNLNEQLHKRYKNDNCNYLEVGLALPSIYV